MDNERWKAALLRGGVPTVGSIFVVGNLLAPVPSLNGSFPCGLMVKLV